MCVCVQRSERDMKVGIQRFVSARSQCTPTFGFLQQATYAIEPTVV